MALFKVKPWYKKRGKQISYYGTTAQGLNFANDPVTSAMVGNYAIFFGDSSQGKVSVYDNFLTAHHDSIYRYEYNTTKQGSATINNYAICAGGRMGSGWSGTTSYVTAYDASLTRVSVGTTLASPRENIKGTTLESYAIFAGGSYNTDDDRKVTAYNGSLTRTILNTELTQASSDDAATTLNNNAIYAGGAYWSSWESKMVAHSFVDIFNNSLTKTQNSLTLSRQNLAAASVGDYALFAGGISNGNVVINDIEVFNTSFTHTIINLSKARYMFAAISKDNFALFGGPDDTIDIYDEHLTNTLAYLSSARYNLAVALAGEYILFAGGRNSVGSGLSSNVVDVYQVA